MHRHSSVNRLYRLVWNDALMIWTAVAEIARGRGKSGTGRRRMAALLALNAGFVLGPPATAGPNNIQPDGRTQTTVTSSGVATSVHTSTTSGSNAFNSFSTFTVGGGQVVNMHLPGGSANLINLVTDSRATINGMLNSIKGNKIGGNVFFASPHGFLVGSGGVVNVGSLTVSTPTRSFLDTFFTVTGDIDALSAGALLDGSAPDEGGSIAIDGTVNAIGGVKFRGGSVRIGGTVYRGAKFVGLASDFSDVVNVNGLAAGTKIVEVDGRIQVVAEDDPAAAVAPVAPAAEADSENATGSVDIQASQDVSVSGVIRNEGSEGVSGGQIAIQAGNNITLEAGANISAAGRGNNSSGGTVYMMAANSAVAQAGALVDSSAGFTGDGGAIEFSARKNVELAGGQFRASATTGTMGTVLIDPETVTVSADYYSGGANHSIVADNTITVNTGVVVSTRNVLGGDTANQTTAASIGNSGSLNLQAGSITLNTGSALISSADSGFEGGDITINATRAAGGALGGGGTAGITATGATIQGAAVSLQAQSDYDDTGALVPLPLAIPGATASISLTDTAVSASGTLAIGAKASVDTSPLGSTPLAISVVNSSATVNVAGTSVLSSAGNATLSAESVVTSNVKPSGLGLALPADAAVAISTINSTATVKVGGSSSVTTDAALELSAKNTVEATTVADITASKPAAVGGTVAVTVLNTVTKASIEDSATTQAASLKVGADSRNTVVNTAKAASKGATKQAAGASKTEETLGDYKEEGKTSEGSVEVAAAVAVVSLNSQTSAVASSTGLQKATTGLVTVSSLASNASTVEADGSSVGGSASVGVGAAVAINIGVLDNTAVIADNAQVDGVGVTVLADNHTGEKNSFSTKSTSGAGASNVGVAGSLAVGTVVSNTAATLEKNTDGVGIGASVTAGGGNVLVQAGNATSSAVEAGAKVTGAGDAAKVGVGASVGVNVGVNTTLAEVGDAAVLAGAANLALNATADHAMTTQVTGGAAGARISVTPVAAVSVGINSTTARLGEGNLLNLGGSYSSQAEQSTRQTTVATGATEGSQVSVGASVAVGVAEDTVVATIERDLTAGSDIGVSAVGISLSDTSATASVKGGQEADEDGNAPAEGGEPGKTVDQQVKAQSDSAKDSGTATAGTGSAAGNKLEASKAKEAPKAEADSNGDGSGEGVSVAAAVGVNVATSETTASIGAGRQITSAGGALSVTSTAETDAKAKADGSQIDAGGTDVGIGAAVAVNAATAKNTAIVRDNAVVDTQGLTVRAAMDGAAKNDFSADAKSGAGAGNVGVAGSLAINIVDNASVARLEGDTDAIGVGASVDANAGNILIEAANASTSTVKAAADVKGTGDSASVGVGASVGVNVAVNSTVAEVADRAVVTGGANMGVKAKADHTLSTELVGGSAGAKTSITPVVAVSIGVNTTQARVGASATGLNLSGAFSSSAEQTHVMTTKATAQAQGDTAVGASLAAAIAVDDVSAELQRDIDSSSGVELIALSQTSITTETTAGAKGAKKAKTNETTGAEEPEANTTVDDQKKNQLDFAKNKNAGAAGVNTDTQEAKTPDTSSKTPGTEKPTQTSEQGRKDQDGQKISVAAAIGVSVARNQGRAEIGQNLNINAGAGELKLDAQSDTNYTTKSSGEAVSEDDAVSVAVAVTATHNVTQATLGAGTTVSQAGDVNVNAESRQNRDAAFQTKMSAEAVSGASGGGTSVAGGLALVVNENKTLASIDEGVTLGSAGSEVGHVSVTAEDTSKISALARAGAISKGGESKTGVGASFAVLVSLNENHAVVGRDADESDTFDATALNAESLTVKATKNRVSTPAAKNLTIDEVKNLDFNTFKPSDYLASNNYYTEAIAGAASQGDTAVAGAFAVNVFTNKSVAELGEGVAVTTTGSAGPLALGVEVSGLSDMQSVTIAGAAAGAKQTGVGISNADTVNLDETRALIGADSTVLSNGANAGVKVQAESLQEMTNVGVSAGASTSGTAVAGVLGVVVALGKTEALIGDGAAVKAKGDVSVKARTDTTGVMVSGGVAAASQTGVGASIAAQILANQTTATIGDADVSSARLLSVSAQAAEDVTSTVLAGAGAGTTAVAGALSVNVIVTDTKALVNQGAQVNTDAGYSSADQGVAITASDDTSILAITGGGAGGGTTGVGAALDTDVMAKTVTAGIADGAGTRVNAKKDVVIDASSSEDLTSVTVGFAGGGTTGVGGAVSVGVVKNDVHAMIGNQAVVDADGNVGVNAQDDIKAVLAAGGLGGGGTTGVGGSIGVATLFGTTRATIGDSAVVNARGLGDARTVYTGETTLGNTSIKPADLGAKKTELAKGLSVTAYNREELITTVFSAGGGGTTGVAATVSADVIANTTEASIGRSARINESNTTAGADQEVRVKAIDETSLINTAGGAGGGGSAGVGAAANVGVIAKTTTAKIGKDTLVNAKKAVEVEAASLDSTLSTTVGLAGGGSVGVGGAVAGVGIANTTQALIEDGTSVADAAEVNVSGGNLSVKADGFANSWMISGGAAGGGAAGVGASLSIAVNASTTKARIGNFAETNATGTTSVHADSTESVNTITVAGAGGGSVGVSGSIAVNVVTSKTEAGIGSNAQVNQTLSAVGQVVDVKATDRIESLSVAGAAAGGGAAGVGAAVAVTVAQNTTQAYIGSNAQVSASQDISVDASSDKLVDSVAAAGAGGGAAGVAGAISVVAVGMVLDGDSSDGLGSTVTNTDSETGKSKVGGLLGSSAQSQQTKSDLDSQTGKMAVGGAVSDSAPVPDQNTIASIGAGAVVKAGRDVTVAASDTTEVFQFDGGAAGGGAAGVAGTLGVTLLRDSAAATVGDGAQVDAGRTLDVSAETRESVLNIGVSAAGGGAAGVSGSVAINVISSETVAAIGASQINQQASASGTQSVQVRARSNTELITVAGSGGGGGAAAVGGVLNVNTLSKNTSAHIAEGADVDADLDVRVAADSEQTIIGAGISVQGSGAASVGGAAAVNVIDNNTQAFIGSARDDATKTAAHIDSSGNVAISAADDTLLMGVSASATGSGVAAVGGAVGVNVITSETLAYLGDDSSVNARGNAANGATVYDGSIDQANARALPTAPAGKGDLDVDGDGVKDGDVNDGASFNMSASGDGGGDASDTSNPETTRDSEGNAISGIAGGLGTRGTEQVKGFSVTAVGSEKIITASLGVAAAGAAGVTGTVTANVISSVTQARIGDGAQVNKTDAAGAPVGADAVGADPSVRVRATGDTLVVMASGTMSGGIAGVSGSVNTVVVDKQTSATIGDADVKARNVDVRAEASEDLFLATANVSVGAAGIGAAVSVASVANTTTAGIDAGANVDATGDLRVKADQATAIDMYTLAGSGGVVAISGAVSVGIVDNTTQAYVEGAASPAQAATLNAGGTTEVAATSREDMSSVTGSAAAGGVGVAGSVGVKVLTSSTTASIGDNTRVNQTRNGAAQDVKVSASDTVNLKGGGAAGAVGGGFGVGAMSDTNIVRNTTTASIGNSALIDADRDVGVTASSSKNVESTAIAIAAGGLFGGAGSASVAVIGASLDDDAQEGLGDGATAGRADQQAQQTNASSQLDDVSGSTHLAGAKSTTDAKAAGLGVQGDMNSTSTASQDKTQAFIGSNSRVTTGGKVDVTASDKTQLDLEVVGAAGGAVGIGAAVGVGIANSTTEAYVGSSTAIDAAGNVSVKASAGNVDANGSKVQARAGAGGVIGVSAAVSVLKDSSTTRAFLGDSVSVERANVLLVDADTDRQSSASTIGVAAGGLAVGASIASATFGGSTSAYFEPHVNVGQTAGKLVNDVTVTATDSSVAHASAIAGAAGILSGSGADATAEITSGVSAYMGSDATVTAQDDVNVTAEATPETSAEAKGVSVGAGSVGASLATARTTSNVEARIDSGATISGDKLDVVARRLVGSSPTTAAQAFGASGGVLFGINATLAKATSSGTTRSAVGDNATLTMSGATTVHADSHTQQVSSGVGISVGGLLAVGADYSEATSSTTTLSSMGNGVKLTGPSLSVLADSSDTNFAHGIAGSGGLVSAPFSEARTASTSQTHASTGSGDNVGGDGRKIDVDAFVVRSSYGNLFDAWMQSTNASLIGVSGAKATNSSQATTSSTVGANGYVEAGSVSVQASNTVEKGGPGTANLPGVTSVTGAAIAVPSWNVDSASGGLADVPAADSLTTITNSAVAQVGAGATLRQTGSISSPGAYKIDAWNDVTARDRVKMASGGAVSAASGSSKVLADTNVAKVKVGDGAALSATGDLMMGARSIADISTQTSVDVWGLVGVAPKGDSVSRFKAVNGVEIGSALLEAQNDIRLNAGASTQYNPETGSNTGLNQGTVVARTDVFNNTAIPVNRDPIADAIIETDSQITIDSGAVLNSVSDVALFAEKGAATASGVGVGKDIYREALAAVGSAISNAFGGGDVSFETRTGNSVKTQTSGVTVNGEIHVGTHRKQNLEIDINGNVVAKTDGISVINTGIASLAQDILDRIDALNDLIQQYSGGGAGTDAAIAVAAYQSEIRFLERKLVELGFQADPSGGGFAGVASLSPKEAAEEAVAAMTATLTGLDTTRDNLTTANNNLTTANNNLTTANNNLTTINNNLTSQNSTLAGEVATLIAQRNALPADDAAGRQALQVQIDAKNGTISTNNGTISTNNGTINTNNDTIGTNTDVIDANNTEIGLLATRITSLDGQIVNVQTDLDDNKYSAVAAAGPTAKFLTISDTEAKLGNIYVRGDKLQGNGVLDAPGDAEIRITNNGPSFLVLNDLTIPADEGGRIYLNSVDVKNNTQINGINGAAGGADFDIFTADSTTDFSGSTVLPGKPKIVVESKYDPLDPFYSSQTLDPATATVAPDIILKGDISNLRGLVKIDSAAGSIRIEETASIRADDVEVKTRNGDFVQSYTNTFSHVAGAPLTTTNGNSNLNFPGNIAQISRTPESAGSGIVANGSVLLAARYLNINGTVQSGIPEWGVRIPADASVTVGGVPMTFAQAQAHYNGLTPDQKAVLGSEYFQVGGATVSGLSGNLQGAWEDVKVSYNAKENRLELSGVRVQGGYIELFGQIFNTNQAAGGKLRVLDGYGQIKVDNESSLPMWVNLLDTGKGVQGEINITNITGIDASGVPTISTTQFLRGAGGSRSAFYDPEAGLRYSMTVGYDEGRVDYYRYSQSGWFGGAILGSKALDEFRIASQVRSNDPLSQAEYLKVVSGPNTAVYDPATSAVYNTVAAPGTGSITGGDQESVATAAPIVTPGRSWRDCNWWTLCINATHYQEFTVTTATKTTITESVKADQRIGIEFIGFDQGTVNVASVGDVVLNGAINNASGETSVSSGGRITQNGDLNIISGVNVNLTAGTGIGSGTQAIQTNISDSGRLNATSSAGEVHIKEMVGNLNVGTIGGAGVSNVVLEADKNIVDAAAGSFIQGRRVELLSNNGGIGATGAPLTVRTGYTTNMSQWSNNGLLATARDSINIRNLADAANPAIYNGNLLLISAESKTGDVRIETSGAVIDNNPFETIDTRTETELANLWDELRLRGAPSVEKANEAVAAFESGKNNNYRQYWQLRKGQADQGAVYDPGYVYAVSAGERSALEAAGLTPLQIDEFAQSRTDQYHGLHAEVGGLTTAFDSGFAYEASTAEEAGIRAGSTWTDAQLVLSVGAGLLKNITDTVTSVKEPNVKGNNIELVAGTSIGSMNPNVDITLPVDATPAQIAAFLAALRPDQKAALAAAERGDATVTDNVISIIRPRAVNVETGTGALTASAAAGDAFIGSEKDLRINQVTASDNVRIKVAGALINAATVAGTNNVVGDNIILEAANGGIGAAGSALRINPTAGSSLIARAAGDIWIETPADLTVDTIFSRNNVSLDAVGSILDMPGDSVVTPAVNIRSNNVTLVSRTGSIGEEDNALDVGVNPDGHVVATADTVGQGIYLNGPSGEHFNVGASTSGGATVLSAAESMKVDGTVTGLGSISLVSGGQTTLTTQADVTSTAASIQIRAGSLTMEDDGVAAARVRSGTGSIDVETVGDAVITGIESGNGTASAVRVVSTGGRVLDGGDTRLDVIADTAPAAKFTVAGLLGVGSDGNPLDVRVRDLNASSVQGSVALAAVGGVNIEAVSAGDAVQITAEGNITGQSVTSTGAGTQGPDKSVSVASTGGSVTLDSVTGTGQVNVDGQTGVNVHTVVSTGGSVLLNSSAGNVVADTTTARKNVTMTAAAGSVTAGTTTATEGNVLLDALGDIEATTTVAGGTARMSSAAGQVRLGSLTARGDVSVDGQAGVQTGMVESTAGSVVLNTNGGDIDAGVTKAWKDVTMRAASGAISADTTVATTGDVTFIARGDINAGSTTAGGTVVFDSREGDVRTEQVSTGGGFSVKTAGNIETGTVTAGRDVSLISTRGTVTADNTRSVRGSVTMEGQRGVTANRVVASQDVTLASASGAVEAGDLLARRGSITLNARGNIDVNTGSAINGSFVAGSTDGSVNVGTASADVVSLSAPRSVTGRVLNVGSRVSLAGQTVEANVNSTGAGDVGGSVTGFGGGMASNVELALNSPFAFRFQAFSTSTGNINVLAGDLFVDLMRVGNRLTISNPRTTLLIDQNDRSIQPFDVQLYSAGNPFDFGLTGNRVLTGAFVIARGPGHEVISPNGNNLSAAELADRELSVLGSLPSPTDEIGNGQPAAGASENLVSYVGTPVNGGDECESEAGQGAGVSKNSNCKEEN